MSSVLKKWALAFVILGAIVVEGTLSLLFEGVIHTYTSEGAIFLTLIVITLSGLVDYQNSKIVWLCLGMGIIADWYFFGFIGIETILFPLTAFSAQFISNIIPETFWARLLVILALTVIWELYSFTILNVFGLITVSIKQLFTTGLPVTLLISSLLYLLVGQLIINLNRELPFLDN